MPKLCRDLDLGSTGHGCTPAIPVKATQSTVRANGKPVARLHDPTLPHTIDVPDEEEGFTCVAHMGKVNLASMTVRANGIGVARVGDSYDFGAMIDGSSNVRAG